MLINHIKKILSIANITIAATAISMVLIHNYNYRNIILHTDDVAYIDNHQLVITNTKDKSINIIRKLDKDSKVIVLKNNIKIQQYPSNVKVDLIFYNYKNLRLKIRD